MSSKSHQADQASPASPAAERAPAQTDIDFDAFGQLMDELLADQPDAAACLSLFDRVGPKGQELVLTDGIMGPKIRAMQAPASGGGWWDVIGAATSSAVGAATGAAAGVANAATGAAAGVANAATGAARGAVDAATGVAQGAVDAASGVLGGNWDPRKHPILERLAAVPEQLLDTGRAVWSGRDEEQAESPELQPVDLVEREPLPAPDLGPNVITRPGERMYETSSLTGRVTIRQAEPVEVVEAVQVRLSDDRFGARVEDLYHIRSAEGATVAIDHWVKFGALTTDAELNNDFAASQKIPLDGLNGTNYSVARIWNEKGGFIDGRRGALTRAVAVAVMKVESGGLGYSGAGDMVIRFENHKLWRTGEGVSKSWGKDNPDKFNEHFRPQTGAADHEINVDGAAKGGTWKPFHGSQTLEWEALRLAIEVSGDAEAAYCAISMGAGQVMGFNANKLGYASATEMFESFDNDAAANIGGVFSFIETNPTAKSALQAGDFTSFVEQYNGRGAWVADYVKMLVEAVSAFETLERAHLQGGTSA
jgi:hypothetical protein